jgi:hypothetical protein
MKQVLLPVTVWALLASGGIDTTAASNSASRVRTRVADSEVQQTIPSVLSTVNPCNGDAVELTGELHILVHFTDATNGSIHGYTALNSRYSGTGVPSLLSYQGSDDILDDFTFGSTSAFVQTTFVDQDLQTQTGVDNYHLRLHLKITINSNGLPTAEVLDFSTTCNG